MATRTSGSLGRWRRQALQRMKSSREETLRLVARLPEDAMLQPRTQDAWSVKDMLGHFMACDEETLRRFQLIARGRPDRITWFESMAYADRFNARTVAAARKLSLRTVLGRMARARRGMIDTFKKLPLASLRDPAHAYPVVDWLTAPGWSHEREHVKEIRDWWRAQARPR